MRAFARTYSRLRRLIPWLYPVIFNYFVRHFRDEADDKAERWETNDDNAKEGEKELHEKKT